MSGGMRKLPREKGREREYKMSFQDRRYRILSFLQRIVLEGDKIKENLTGTINMS